MLRRQRQQRPDEEDELGAQRKGLIEHSVAALIAGALTGVVGALFRLTLYVTEEGRDRALAWAHHYPALGWLVPIAMGALAAVVARWLVRFAPMASGSGVQHVEAVMRHEAEPAPLRVVPVKFIGGGIAIGAGFALGREGPTVQMGASIGHTVGRWLRMAKDDLRELQSATAGAGLAVAFNAPLGGALFTFEEVAKKFTLRLTLSTLLAAGVAIAVSRLILGDHPDFNVASLSLPPFGAVLLFALLGAGLGALGWLYNKMVVLGLELVDKLRRWPVELRAALIGVGVGLLAWFAPPLVGGGELLNQRLLVAGLPLASLMVVLAVRTLLGVWSYSAGVPGGLFAPLLVVGAAFGGAFGILAHHVTPTLAPDTIAYAVVGMAAFFAAVVRAPLTGVALIVEMTAISNQFVPMLVACFAATVVATALKSEPIYDTLRKRMLDAEAEAAVTATPTHAASRVSGG